MRRTTSGPPPPPKKDSTKHGQDVEPELPLVELPHPRRSGRPPGLRQLCDAYGLEDRRRVLAAVWSRLETFIEWLEAGAAAGDPLRNQTVEAGEAAHHRRRLKYLNDVQAEFAAALR